MPWVPWLCLTGAGLCSHLSRPLDRAWARLSVPQLRPLLASPSWQNSDDYRDLRLHLTQLCANNWEQRRFLSHFCLISDYSTWDFIGAQWMFMEMKLGWQWHVVPPFPNTGWAWLCSVSVTQELALLNCLCLDAAMCSERPVRCGDGDVVLVSQHQSSPQLFPLLFLQFLPSELL